MTALWVICHHHLHQKMKKVYHLHTLLQLHLMVTNNNRVYFHLKLIYNSLSLLGNADSPEALRMQVEGILPNADLGKICVIIPA